MSEFRFYALFMHFYALFMHFYVFSYAFLCIFVHHPQMVFDHNLHYMAPFAIPRAGFCTEFRRASVVFSYLGVDFVAAGWIFRPWGWHSGPGTILASSGVPKKIILQRNHFVRGWQGNPSCPNEF